MRTEISEWGVVLLFFIGALLFLIVGLFIGKIIRPRRPNPEKLSNYECGEEPIGTAWGKFNNRFYVIGLIFVIFEVEIVFLFPWATVFGQKELIEATEGQWGWFSLIEVFIFTLILVVGLIFVWAKGYLDWIKPIVSPPDFSSKIPRKVYEQFNEKQSSNAKKILENEPV